LGSIKEEDINEIQDRNNIVEVISEYITLKKSGRSFKGLCPFHKEKTPSFMVDPTKQLFHCFGCDVGGNVFNFIMGIENADFPDAVQMLADRVGYRITYEKADTKKYSRQTRLYEINNQAMLYYQRILFDNEIGLTAREYLKSRGYDGDIARNFKLGVASSQWDDLINYLRKKGFSPEEIKDAGLAIDGKKSSTIDRFRSRIMFPIFDLKGRTVAFGGRVFGPNTPKDAPKYMNSPETPVYHKSSILYWLNEAKGEIVKQSEALIVEGYTDVISLNQAGIKNVVATCGTAFTPDHLKALSRFAERIVLVFDADTAGEAAMERGLELLGEEKTDIFVLSLPAGFDPADFVVKKGKSEFMELLKKAVILVDFCIDRIIKKHDTNTSNGRIKAATESLEVILRVPNELAQQEYLRKLGDKLGASSDSLYLEFNKLKKSKKRRNKSFRNEQEPSNTLKLDPQGKAESEILKLILHCSEYSERIFSTVEEAYFMVPEHRKLFERIKGQYEKDKVQVEVNSLLNIIKDEKEQKLISRLTLDFVMPEDKEEYFQDILLKLKEFDVQRQINMLRGKLERLNPVEDPVKYDALFEELIGLEAEKRDLQLRS